MDNCSTGIRNLNDEESKIYETRLEQESVAVVPVRYGKWYGEKYSIGCQEWSARCTNCHYIFESKYMITNTYRFCPFCGADMITTLPMENI